MTTTTTSLELIQDLYAAFGRGDTGYILEHLSDDCRWVSPGEGLPNAGVFEGKAGAAQFFERLAASEDITRFEVREFFVNGDSVVALGHEECRSKLTGRTAQTNFAMLFRVREGKVTNFEGFFDTAAYARMHQA
ncbi:MAG: nuclear transport factor 2 family protein [Bryobacterales bacterium]|nr:nuclear transport factor 2 family protein [Bryobacterales bacterium]